MSARVFVDTNILVYAHDASAGARNAQARDLVEGLWKERSGVVSTQVLQELHVNVRRKAARPLTAAEARELVADYLRWEVVVNTGESILEAIDLEARFLLSFWDALIVQAALTAGVDTLFTEDFSHGQTFGAVRVVNPFAR
jgi:predicted nucleic acid-binding protein